MRNNILTYPLRVWRWIRGLPRILWISLFIFAGWLVWMERANWSQASVSQSGAMLQIIGVIQVIVGLENTRTDFGKPNVLKRITDRLRTFPRLKPPSTIHASGVSSGTALAHRVVASAVGSFREKVTIDERVGILEQTVKRIERQQVENRNEANTWRNELTQAIQNERATRIDDVRNINNKLVLAQVGGLDLSAFGAATVLAGTFLAGFADIISKALAR